MDMRTGKLYPNEQAALDDGVPADSVAGVEAVNEHGIGPNGEDWTIVRIMSGPFKGRIYRRLTGGGLQRIAEKK